MPYAFINEIQYVPMDLYSKDFYNNRSEAIDKRLKEVRSGWSSDALLCFIVQNWEKHAHKRSLIVSDLIDGSQELIEIITCIGRECLAMLLERLAKNFKQFHSGLPDLFVWNAEKRKVCLILHFLSK